MILSIPKIVNILFLKIKPINMIASGSIDHEIEDRDARRKIKWIAPLKLAILNA